MRNVTSLMVFLTVLLSNVLFAQITIDGDMFDWAGIPAADQNDAAEELGDYIHGANYDLQNLYITGDDSMLYMRITIDPSGSFGNGWAEGYAFSLYLDQDVADTSGLTWGWWTTAINYLVDLSPMTDPSVVYAELPIVHYTGKMNSSIWPDDWQDTTGVMVCAINAEDNEMEMAIPLSLINAGSVVRPVFEIVGKWDWGTPAELMPNGQSTNPAWMVEYHTGKRESAVYAHRGAQIEDAIVIDGDMFDWAGISVADVNEIAEETGDMPTGADFDIQDVSVASDSDYVYVRIAINPSGSFTGQFTNYANPPVFELWFDTFLDDTTGLGWGGFWVSAGDYKVELPGAYDPNAPQSELTLYHYSADYNGAFENYDSVGVAMAVVNSSDNEIEVAVPRTNIVAGSDVRIFIYSVGDYVWDNEEYFPNDQTNDVGPSYALNYNFVTGPSIVQTIYGTTGIKPGDNVGEELIADEFGLAQNYPNPFNPSTNIQFNVPAISEVEVFVSNVLGQRIKTLHSGVLTPGIHNVNWNGRNDNGQLVSSGIYFYTLASKNTQITRKMLFVR